LQSALNAIWKAETPQGESGGAVQAVSRFVRAKAAAIGLVAATGFLLLVSLVVSASVAAFTTWMGHIFPGAAIVGPILTFAVSFAFVTAMFAAIYKVLPDRHLEWRDVLIGAAATSLLFTVGKTLISWYVGSGAVASSFGAAGSLAVLLVWIYYSAQIFLFGAEFTRAWAGLEGSHQNAPVPAAPPALESRPRPTPGRPGWSLARVAGSLALSALLFRRKRNER
jgi:membrane protein